MSIILVEDASSVLATELEELVIEIVEPEIQLVGEEEEILLTITETEVQTITDETQEILLTIEEPTVVVVEGNPGPQGPPGPMGPAGSGASVDRFYTHNQLSASTSWVINHNMGKYPSVQIIDSSGNNVYAGIAHPSDNQTVLTFSTAFGGVAYLN